MLPERIREHLWTDLPLVAFLIALDVTARLLPHAPGVWPLAASALFAGRVLRLPMLAVIVPLGALLLSNAALTADDWRVTLVVCLATVVPAFAGMLARRWRGALPVIAAMLSSSLVFFLSTNLAVWAFSGMYSLTWQGLLECIVAAIPFLDRTVLGDLLWIAVLFGGYWAFLRLPAFSSRPFQPR
ncbi:MAG TPA: DUF6580 family putative transport protein [Pseudolabrys sp.]|nr:DUF6580 family putative transport protein [Pseudolabrys sp.]